MKQLLSILFTSKVANTYITLQTRYLGYATIDTILVIYDATVNSTNTEFNCRVLQVQISPQQSLKMVSMME